MADEKEVITEEIYEYYRDKTENNPAPEITPDKREDAEALETTSSQTLSEPVTKQRETIFASASEVISGITNKLAKNPQDKIGIYITLAVLASVIVIMCGYITGLFIPKNKEYISAEIDKLRSSDTEYIAAAADNERLNERVEDLYDEKAEVKAELNGITDYETIRDHAKQDIDDISAQLDELKNQISAKQAQVNELDVKIREIGGALTLKPGMYTVGEHIAAGEYHVKGNGSILVSDSESKLKINTKLTQSAAYTCRLSNNDTIKLETEAEFNPAQ